jgi:hypothetical protein
VGVGVGETQPVCSALITSGLPQRRQPLAFGPEYVPGAHFMHILSGVGE